MTGNRIDNAFLLREREAYVARGHAAAHPVFASRAEGCRVWDVDGNVYLDFAAGIGALNVGHNHPRVVAAVRHQLDQYLHTCFSVVMYEPYVTLAQRLGELIGPGRDMKAFFATTGVEAVENAVKIARAATRRTGIIAFTSGFHGRTLMGMTLTGMSTPYKQQFGPLAPEVYHAPYPDEYRGWTTERALDGLHQLFATHIPADRVAAIIIEPQLGDGGFIPAPPEYLRHLREITEENGIVLVCDEIQTGFGRTGVMFGYEHAGIEPDLVVLGKGLAGGIPLSAVVGPAALMDAPEVGGLGGTYAGNPLGCVAALAVLDLFRDEPLLERAQHLGAILRDGLTRLRNAHRVIGDVRGLGAMLAIEMVNNREDKEPDEALAQAVLNHARTRGLILLRCGLHRNVVRLLPPLITSDADAHLAIDILNQAFDGALTERRALTEALDLL